jgi:hypothetical protein
MKQENKNKDMTSVKQESNKILLQGRNKNRMSLWQKNVPKIGVEQIKGNDELYLYLYPLNT